MTIIVTVALYAFNNQPNMRFFRNKYPYLFFVVIFLLGYIIIYWLDCVSIFLLSILLPLSIVISHALLRTRNIENKIVNKAESLRITKTPMGVLLSLVKSEDL